MFLTSKIRWFSIIRIRSISEGKVIAIFSIWIIFNLFLYWFIIFDNLFDLLIVIVYLMIINSRNNKLVNFDELVCDNSYYIYGEGTH